MCRRIVGYEGEGKRRRPVYSDPIELDLTGNPPGPVTRRVATDAERGGFASRVQGPGLIRLPRHSPLITPPKAIAGPPVTEPEEPVMEPIAAPLTDVEPEAGAAPETPTEDELERSPIDPLAEALWALRDAADEAAESWSLRLQADDRWRGAEAALVAAGDAVRLASTAGAIVAALADHYGSAPSVAHLATNPPPDIPGIIPEPADDNSAVVTSSASRMAAFAAARSEAAAGGGPTPSASPKQDRILAAIVPNAGDLRAIAAANHTTPGNVTATLHNAGKRHRLTADMIAVLPAAFARYAGV